jgi:hypothetical protein
MKSRRHACVLIAFSLACASFFALSLTCRLTDASSASADPADLLPLDNDISGFAKKGSTAVMTDQQTILNAIDGAAEVYILFNFREGVEQLYSNGSVDIDVQIFNQGDPQNALDLYNNSAIYPTSPLTIDQPDAKVVVENAAATAYRIQYTRQNIFMRISTTVKSDFALNMAKQFYRNIDNKIGVK